MKFKFIIVILLFVGILCMTVSLTKSSTQCPESKITYRYIPRTFEEEQTEPVFVSEIFEKMFLEQSPWVKSINSLDAKKNEQLNKYFVSQY